MNDDWRDLLFGFRAVEARFLVIGAHAMAVHGVPRGTQDIDLWIEPTKENAEKIWKALSLFGAPLGDLGITLEDLHSPERVIQLGLPPNRIDLLTSVSGLPDFAEAWANRVECDFEGVAVAFLGRQELIRNNARPAGSRT